MVRRFCEALHVDAPPKTRYARNGEVHLAYQELGEGALDIVEIESWVHHVEAFWAVPELARQRRRLAAIGRLIMLDRRGTGLSDPVALDRLPDLETQVEDVIAVMDAAGCEQAAILGFTDGRARAAPRRGVPRTVSGARALEHGRPVDAGCRLPVGCARARAPRPGGTPIG